MNLAIEITPDYHGSIAIIDYTLITEYLDDNELDLLPNYTKFKYKDTCTIDVLNRIKTDGVTSIITTFVPHDSEMDSVRFPLPEDGYYSVDHVVLPTVKWLNSVSNLDLSHYSNGIYVTDGTQCYFCKQVNSQPINVETDLEPVDVSEVIIRNPENTTISIASYKVFSIDNLKHCYINLAKLILNSTVKCNNIDSTVRFNRDFLLMTISTINFHLEENEYSEAEIILENLNCYNICGGTTHKPFNSRPCGCQH